MEQIEQIVSDAQNLHVDEFAGIKGDKQFMHIEEMLTRLLIKLDKIDSEGRGDIRGARREAVRIVQAMSDRLEVKASAATKPGDCRAVAII